MNAFPQQSWRDLEAAIARRFGLAADRLGDANMERALRAAAARTGTAVGPELAERLLHSADELDALIDDLVVPETWFFRDRTPFRCVQQYVRERAAAGRLPDPLRALAIPCSTGEEPYSLAMALLDVGLAPGQFRIVAADLSRKLLAQAAEACFGRNSLRGDEQEFSAACARRLAWQGDRFTLDATVRQCVEFVQANLAAPQLLPDQSPFHVIFCRNVLIYLAAPARSTALANLHRLLHPTGILYTGHAEARLAAAGRFVSWNPHYPAAFAPQAAGAFAPQAAGAFAPQAAPQPPAAASVERGSKPLAEPLRVAAPRRAPLPDGPPAATQDVAADRLVAARAAADAGQFAVARQLCDDLLAARPADAEACFLLGVVAQAEGRPAEAERLLRRTLYLNPRHADALTQMALLSRRRGDERGAALYAQRARRIAGGEEPS